MAHYDNAMRKASSLDIAITVQLLEMLRRQESRLTVAAKER
jgi:hypothetical protein